MLIPMSLNYLLVAKRSGVGPADMAYLAFTFAFCTWAPLMMKAFGPKAESGETEPEHE